mmetsp:Transcript_58409/g.142855  ORF Transcript_58409/g.142855 Transcript_58409/m.142855 type:complete len:531 (-) Transcript_58409:171-1763(-)
MKLLLKLALLICTAAAASSSSAAAGGLEDGQPQQQQRLRSLHRVHHRVLDDVEEQGGGPMDDNMDPDSATPVTERTRTDIVPMSPFDVQIAFASIPGGGTTEQGDEDNDLLTALTVDSIDAVTVNNAITDWMLASFTSKAPTTNGIDPNLTTFDTLSLEVSDAEMQSSTVTGRAVFLYTAYMDGVSIWERLQTTDPVNPDIVELIQRASFLEDNDLLQLLVSVGPDLYVSEDDINDAEAVAAGFDLLTSVEIIDVRAFVAPPRESDDGTSTGTNTQSDSDDQNLEIIIIIAIVVACLAFALLVFAVVWAWRSDRQSNTGNGKQSSSPSSSPARESNSHSKADKKISSTRQSSSRKKVPGSPEPSDESEVEMSANAASNGRKSLFGRGNSKKAVAKSDKSAPVSKFEPVVVEPSRDINNTLSNQAAAEAGQAAGAGGDSVISDDVNTSLTAYYKTGVSGYAGGSRQRGGYGDDAASLSSMDSYGYSLDGYAPSLGTAPNGYPVGPLAQAGQASIKVGDEDEEIPQEEVEDF